MQQFRDPITTSWVIALAVLFTVVVVIPLIRLVLSAALYALATVSGRPHLRLYAARMMPRIGHLIGSVVVGVASIAAPAIAQPHADELLPISIDRMTLEPDIGAPEQHVDVTAPVQVPEPTGTTQSAGSSDNSAGLYVVKVGDSLWGIAKSQLDNPTDAETTETWKAIWRANRRAIGDRPELIRPGTELFIEGHHT